MTDGERPGRRRSRFDITTRPLVYGGNRVRLLENGDEYFPRLLAAIEGAARSITIANIQIHFNSEEAMENQPMMDVTSDDKLWAALSYVFAPLIGIIVLLMQDKKARPFIKFHAVQSIAVSVAFWILATILTTVTLGFGGLCVPLVWLVFLYWAYKAYQGETINIPVVTNFIKNHGWA